MKNHPASFPRSAAPAFATFRIFFGIVLLAIHRPAYALTPALPVIPGGVFNILNYGAVGDGVTTNTTAIQAAVTAASGAGGGTVEIPAGTFLSGPFTLANNINLQLDSGALLRMLPYGKYPGDIISPPNFISGSSLHDVEISGPGAIDGQGLPWWQIAGTNSAANRPNMVNFSACTRVLIQTATFSNSPSPHLVVKGRAGNVTIQNVNIIAPSSGAAIPSHNTDAIDLAETNALIQNCNIAVGDDNVAVGSSASVSTDILITNCTFGVGHGVSIGSFTSGGVSNMTVINCTFTNTDQGIRIKSDRDRGGLVRNISYLNLTMSNVQYPILIYADYTNTTSLYTSLNNLTPGIVSTYPTAAVTSKTPIYRDILISNVTATAQSGRMAGLIWGLPEMAITNLTLNKVTLTGSKTLGVYDAQNIQFIDSQVTVPGTVRAVSFYNAQINFSNSAPAATLLTLDGSATNSIGNALSFFNVQATLQKTNALNSSPGLALAAGTFIVSNHLNLAAATPVNFTLGSTAAQFIVRSNFTLNSTLNLAAGAGFGAGTYSLFAWGGTFGGTPVLGSTPTGFLCSLNTNTPGQINVDVIAAVPPNINTQPADLTAIVGTTALVNVGVAGTPPLNFQWKFFGTNLPGATANPLALVNVQTNQAGNYFVVITNAYGAITSAVARLTVVPPPPLAAWGDNEFGQAALLPGLTNVVAIAAGGYHNLALFFNGTIAAWGDDGNGQCDVPAAVTNVTAISAGGSHSLAALGDGTVAAWGANDSGQTTVPSTATNVITVAAGAAHSLALRGDGSVIAWGDNSWGQISVPAGATNLLAVSAGGQHSLALTADGTVLAWGSDAGPYGNYAGQVDVPFNLAPVVAVAAGGFHSLALTAAGTVVAWGDNSLGQLQVPSTLTNVIAIAAGYAHSLALRSDGTVVAWGDNLFGQSVVPTNLIGVVAVAAGDYHSLTFSGQPPPAPQISGAARTGKTFTALVPTVRGKTFFLYSKNSLSDSNWTWLGGISGDSSQKPLNDPAAAGAQRFYRVRRQ